MYNVEISDRAEKDLENIIIYISQNLAAPKAASDFADSVFDCYDRLEDNPYIYRLCHDPRLSREGYHRVPVKNYLIVFKIHEDKKEVHVHAIFHGRQDYINLI
jgi:plasmid stabilization system protein ParE